MALRAMKKRPWKKKRNITLKAIFLKVYCYTLLQAVKQNSINFRRVVHGDSNNAEECDDAKLDPHENILNL